MLFQKISISPSWRELSKPKLARVLTRISVEVVRIGRGGGGRDREGRRGEDQTKEPSVGGDEGVSLRF